MALGKAVSSDKEAGKVEDKPQLLDLAEQMVALKQQGERTIQWSPTSW